MVLSKFAVGLATVAVVQRGLAYRMQISDEEGQKSANFWVTDDRHKEPEYDGLWLKHPKAQVSEPRIVPQRARLNGEKEGSIPAGYRGQVSEPRIVPHRARLNGEKEGSIPAGYRGQGFDLADALTHEEGKESTNFWVTDDAHKEPEYDGFWLKHPEAQEPVVHGYWGKAAIDEGLLNLEDDLEEDGQRQIVAQKASISGGHEGSIPKQYRGKGLLNLEDALEEDGQRPIVAQKASISGGHEGSIPKQYRGKVEPQKGLLNLEDALEEDGQRPIVAQKASISGGHEGSIPAYYRDQGVKTPIVAQKARVNGGREGSIPPHYRSNIVPPKAHGSTSMGRRHSSYIPKYPNSVDVARRQRLEQLNAYLNRKHQVATPAEYILRARAAREKARFARGGF